MEASEINKALIGTYPALFSFYGLQYKRIEAEKKNEEELAYLQDHLRIFSGLYGMLRPFDAIPIYRLDFNETLSEIGPVDLYWKPHL